MGEVNLVDLIKQWCAAKILVQVRDTDIDLDRLKLTVKSVTFESIHNDDHETVKANVKVVPAANARGAVGQVNASKESNITRNVTLSKGVMGGLNRMVNLPLAGSELSQELGNSLKINIGKDKTELTDTMTISVSLEAGANVSATAAAKKRTYIEQFEGKVTMSGQVIIDDNGNPINQGIHDIIHNLQDFGVFRRYLEDPFRVNGKEVTFSLHGQITYMADYEQSMEFRN